MTWPWEHQAQEPRKWFPAPALTDGSGIHRIGFLAARRATEEAPQETAKPAAGPQMSLKLPGVGGRVGQPAVLAVKQVPGAGTGDLGTREIWKAGA